MLNEKILTAVQQEDDGDLSKKSKCVSHTQTRNIR